MGLRQYRDINGMLDMIGAARIIADSGERIIGINTAACALTGWRHDDMLIRHLDEVMKLAGDDGNAVYPNKEAIIRKEAVVLPDRTLLLSREGKQIYISGGIVPITDKGIVISTDIIFIACCSNGAGAAYADQILKLIPDMLIRCDTGGNILDVAASREEMLHLPIKELSGRNLADIFPKRKAFLFINHIQKALETKSRQTMEYSITAKRDKRWYEAKTIPICGNETLSLIADITARKKTEKDLLFQNRLRKFISGISSGLVKAGSMDMDASIDDILGKIGGFFDADRTYLFKFSPDKQTMINTHEWCRRGISPQKDEISDYSTGRLSWWKDQIFNGETVVINDTEILPNEAAAEKYEFTRQGIKSLLTVPLYSDGRLTGFMGLDSVRKKIKWEHYMADCLQMLANTISDAQSGAIAERAILLEREQFRTTLLSVGDGIISADGSGRVSMINEAAGKLIGIKRKKAVGKPADEILNIMNRQTRERYGGIVGSVLTTGKTFRYEEGALLLSADGSERNAEVNAAPIRDARGNSSGAVVVLRDCTDKVIKQEEIEYISFHDKLTGLYNRRFYEEEVRRLDTARNLPLAVIIGDINGLKAANDSYGHDTGDELLKAAAKAFVTACRSDDIIARIGGDEFVVLLPKTCMGDAQKICVRINDTAEAGKVCTAKLSITLAAAVKENIEQNFRDMVKAAEDKMYRKKLLDLRSSRSDTVASLSRALREMNHETEEHGKRLLALASQVGTALCLMPQEIEELKLLAVLHDIGKLSISKEIIMKNGPLDTAEWTEMKRHSEIGYRIAVSTPGLSHISKYILSVHERWDGKGYPQGLAGNATPKLSRIIAIIDAFDAMVSGRPYKKPVSLDDALKELIRCGGTQFDPLLVDVFTGLFADPAEKNKG